jgi:hypothetical protein
MADYDITVTVPNQGPPGPQGPPGITDASLLDSGTLADARLSTNVPLKDASNTFTQNQTLDGTNNVAPNQTAASGSSIMTRDLVDARVGQFFRAFSISDESVSNSNAYNASSNATISLDIGTYLIEAFAEVQTTATTGVGTRAGLAFSGSLSSSRIVIFRAGPTALTPLNQAPTLDNGTTTLNYQGLNVSGSLLYRLHGRIVVSASGALRITFGQGTATAGQTATLMA